MTAPHILVIEDDPDQPEELRYRVECPGVTEHCRMWEECQPCNADEEISEALWDDEERHDQTHQYIGDLGWSIAVDRCFVADNDRLRDAADSLAWGRSLTPGRYAISFTAEEGVYLELDLVAVAS